MADDIDIEEHDILQDPLIQKIFPDISLIKQEISEYFDEASTVKQELIRQGTNPKPVLASKVKKKNLSLKKQVNKTNVVFNQNTIIIGTKPTQVSHNSINVQNEAIKKYNLKYLKINLHDLGPYLKNNGRYCNKCNILFPSIGSLNRHQRSIHITRNKKTLNIVKTKVLGSFKCLVCKMCFSNNFNLKRHLKQFHVKNSLSLNTTLLSESELEKKEKVNTTKINNVSQNQQSSYHCSICKKKFKCASNLFRHRKNIHNIQGNGRQKRKIDSKTKSNISENKCLLNTKTVKCKPEQQKKECFHCKKIFPDSKSLIEHVYQVLAPINNKEGTHARKENEYNAKPSENTLKANENKPIKERSNQSKQKFESEDSGDMDVGDNQHSSSDAESKSKKNSIEENTNGNAKSNKNVINRLKFETDDVGFDMVATDEYENLDEAKPKPKKKLGKEVPHGQRANKSKVKSYNKINKHLEFETDDNFDIVASDEHESLDKVKPKKKLVKEIPHQSQRADKSKVKSYKMNKYLQFETDDNSDDMAASDAYESLDEVERKPINKSVKKIPPQNLKSKKGNDNSVKKFNYQEDISVSDGRESLDDVEPDSDWEETLKNPVRESGKIDKGNKNKLLYCCPLCSLYTHSVNAYKRHLLSKHNIMSVPKTNMLKFNAQCKFCDARSANYIAYNQHLYRYHWDLIHKDIKLNTSDKGDFNKHFACKSIIFKCIKCDIHFLSAETARHHLNHIEILVNWKCALCSLIFKESDKVMHLVQHSASENIKVYNLDKDRILLFSCTKCAVHFSEKQYIQHYPKCGTEITASSYCKVCDILIDKSEAINHEKNHRNINLAELSSNVVVSDLIFDAQLNIESTKRKTVNNDYGRLKKIRKYEKYESFTFCKTCKCFINDRAAPKKVHIDGLCSNIPRAVCDTCGLVLTPSGAAVHKQHHHVLQNLSLQDFIFYDIDRKQIDPPIPEYPQCEICEVQFINKNIIKMHVCTDIKYNVCKICNIKLSDTVFKLHMMFHKYTEVKDLTGISEEPDDINVKEAKDLQVEIEVIDEKLDIDNIEQNENKLSDMHQTSKTSIGNCDDELYVIFSCKSCFVALDSYDTVIEHCRSHYVPGAKQITNFRTCDKCNFRFDFLTYERHTEIHKNKTVDEIFVFDPKYFKLDNKLWIKHVFNNFPREKIKKIIGKSIYEQEHRIKLNILQRGSHHLTIYKCFKCGIFIDPQHIFQHTENKCSSRKQKWACFKCGLPFLDRSSRKRHAKIHTRYADISLKSYNIVVFNLQGDQNYNNRIFIPNKYVFYQCRNCTGLIDKSKDVHECNVNDLRKCTRCGLLLYNEYYKTHISKHIDLVDFSCENMKVILSGNKTTVEDSVFKERTSFKGLIYDYTLHQCVHCELCIRSEKDVAKHKCKFGINRFRCSICDFYFTEQSLIDHNKTHSEDPDFNKDNIHVVSFDLKEFSEVDSTTEPKEKVGDTEMADIECKANKTFQDEKNAEISIVPKLYKCKCELHFVDKFNALKHCKNCNPRIKSYKQHCTKCNLLFNPSELFTHLLQHHGGYSHGCTNDYDIEDLNDDTL